MAEVRRGVSVNVAAIRGDEVAKKIFNNGTCPNEAVTYEAER